MEDARFELARGVASNTLSKSAPRGPLDVKDVSAAGYLSEVVCDERSWTWTNETSNETRTWLVSGLASSSRTRSAHPSTFRDRYAAAQGMWTTRADPRSPAFSCEIVTRLSPDRRGGIWCPSARNGAIWPGMRRFVGDTPGYVENRECR